MDVTEVNMSNEEERRFGELEERVERKHTLASWLCVCTLTFSRVIFQTTRTTCWKRRSTWTLSLKSLILTKVKHAHEKSVIASYLTFAATLTSLCLYFLQRCRNFQSEKKMSEKVKLESLAGPEAALQTKHTAFCPGRRDATERNSVLPKCFVVKCRKNC